MYFKKPYLSELKRLRTGSYRSSAKGIFLDRNERFLPFDKKTSKALNKRLSKVKLNFYPDLEPFYTKLTHWLAVDRSQIFLTEGVSGAIKSLVECLTIPGKNNIVFPYPTFALYPIYCKMFDVEVKMVGYDNNYKIKFQNLLDSIDNKTALVFLPNPNVPIEGTVELKKIKFLIEVCKKNNAMLVLDEVYYPFGNITGIKLINEFNNLFIMRSFSKAFGLASIRLGYLVGTADNIDYVSKTRTGYESNSFSTEAAAFFIDNESIVLDYIQQVKEGLKYLKNGLMELNIEFDGGKDGCFIFVNLHDYEKKNKIVNKLKEKNIFVRGDWPSPYDEGFSITGAPKKIMQKFFKEFSQIFRSI